MRAPWGLPGPGRPSRGPRPIPCPLCAQGPARGFPAEAEGRVGVAREGGEGQLGTEKQTDAGAAQGRGEGCGEGRAGRPERGGGGGFGAAEGAAAGGEEGGEWAERGLPSDLPLCRLGGSVWAPGRCQPRPGLQAGGTAGAQRLPSRPVGPVPSAAAQTLEGTWPVGLGRFHPGN